MWTVKDLTLKKFDRRTVVWLNKVENHRTYRDCECECGNRWLVLWANLTCWTSHSCWCKSMEIKSRITTPQWMNKKILDKRYWIQRRCYNKNLPNYKYRWWRGIKCEREYFNDFKRDMYESYLEHVKEFWEKQTTLDRIDNDLNYCKENCRRATRIEQRHNQTHKILTHNAIKLWI